MNKNTVVTLSAALIAVSMLASCANTIRGVGKDAASTVNATQAAGKNVAHAARK